MTWSTAVVLPRPNPASFVTQYIESSNSFDWASEALGPVRVTVFPGASHSDRLTIATKGAIVGALSMNLSRLVYDAVVELGNRGRTVQLDVWNFGDGSAPRLMTASPSGIARYLIAQL
jgi:hypothetical protein